MSVHVCLLASVTHLLIVCVFVSVCVYYFILVLYPFTSVEPSVWTTSEQWCSRDTSHRWKEERLFFFYVHSTFKLYELVIVLWLSFGRVIENGAEYMVCLHVWDQWNNMRKSSLLGVNSVFVCFSFFVFQGLTIVYTFLIKGLMLFSYAS